MTPLVSIIVPCFNAEAWLAETLESALAQTWPNKEIVVVNDGSTDNSLAIAQGFSPRGVKVLDQANRGASAARNHGLRLTRGEFIQFLDADDLLAPEKIARQIALLQQRAVGTIASCAWGRFQKDPQSARFTDIAVFRDFKPLEFLCLAGETGAMMHPSAWLISREVAERAGPWDETLSLNDDGEYFCRVALASSGIAYCSDETARSYYRSGLPGSLSQRRSEQARRSQYRSIELITAKLKATEDSDRIRQACAGHWRRFVHDFFPFPAELIKRAEGKLHKMGEALGRPPMGPKTAALAALIGWRNVWRLKQHLGR